MNSIESYPKIPDYSQNNFRKEDEVLLSITPVVEKNLKLLRPVESIWQPSDLLPDLKSEDWREKLTDLREGAKGVSDELFVVLIGDTITEEALPAYMTWLNRFQSVNDKSGVDESPWAQWSRGWTAEENRHGDVLTAYLRYSGRVNMRAVEVTTQYLLKNGFDPKLDGNPYKGIFYTSYQEEATQVSHANVARKAREQGDEALRIICASIAGDEGRHKLFYQSAGKALFEKDPEGSVVAFEEMIREGISMPGALMTDDGEVQEKRQESNLFERFATVAVESEVYTPRDYTGILEGIVKQWDIEHIPVSGEAGRAQEALFRRMKILKKRTDQHIHASRRKDDIQISWVDNPIRPLSR